MSGHAWESGQWGVIIGVSRCKNCGVLSRDEDFELHPDGFKSLPGTNECPATPVSTPAGRASPTEEKA